MTSAVQTGPAQTGTAPPEDFHGNKHPYHLVDPSPWPFVGSLSALALFGGAVMFMHEATGGAAVMGAGLIAVLATMYMWWRDVIREATFGGYHTKIVQLGMRYGMALFIASEVMFFVAWFWAYFNASLFPTEVMGGVWPPTGIETLDPWHLPLMNTMILLLSGVTVTWAHHELREGNVGRTLQGLALTIVLGLVFSGVQAYEYGHATFGFQDGIYPTTFYMATGFHGFHVIVGTIFLMVCFVRTAKGHFKPDHHFGFEAAAWYWHFVDVVWLFLFVCIYWWGSGTPAAH